jgi:hypothetical protein
MDTALLLLALLAQAADATITCDQLRHGAREQNPMMGHTCTQIATRKALLVGGVALVPYRRARLALTVGLIGGGSIGVTVNLIRR